MKIIIITLSMTSIERSQFYNSQDQGLGRALANLDNEVDIYNFIKDQTRLDVKLCDKCNMHYLPSKSIGYHSINSASFIKKGTDCVICFSDNQLLFSHIYNVCKKNNVICLPYVGVVGSNNDSRLKSVIMNMLVKNVKIYKKTKVLAKTPDVKQKMNSSGIDNVLLAPVCLDESHLNTQFENNDRIQLRQSKGYLGEDKIILYIGRLQPEKQPMELIDIFKSIYAKDSSYKMIMISSGSMLEQVNNKINALNLGDRIQIVDRVKNSDMWEYYRISDVFVNLNTHEIFGMAILEAMYYKCKVVAMHAPGPDYIIGDSKYGVLCNEFEDISEAVLESGDNVNIITEAHNRVCQDFLWEATAKIICKEGCVE